MKTLKRFAFMPALLMALLSLAAVAVAEKDPPSRAARLKYMSGEVSMQPGGVDDFGLHGLPPERLCSGACCGADRSEVW